MKQSERTSTLLIEHYQTYPNLQIRDMFKYIHQSAFGCEHMVSSLNLAIEYIRKEYEKGIKENETLIEALDGDYSRVHLSYIDKGLSIETFGSLFFGSANKESGAKSKLIRKLEVFKELVSEKVLPFSQKELGKEIKEWEKSGYLSIHHSDIFRELYHPAYRVIDNKYLDYLTLFVGIDKMLKKGTTTIAIEGGSASGKTTLSQMLREIYDCQVFHMDDFFLRPEQRTPERYAEIGGNVDRERFLEDVLIPLSKGETIDYQRFDCATMKLKRPIKKNPGKLNIIEGAYSMHPELVKFYDLSIFLDISSELQRERILKRNSPQMANRFFDEWIPLEKEYFFETQVKERCDMCISVLQKGNC